MFRTRFQDLVLKNLIGGARPCTVMLIRVRFQFFLNPWVWPLHLMISLFSMFLTPFLTRRGLKTMKRRIPSFPAKKHARRCSPARRSKVPQCLDTRRNRWSTGTPAMMPSQINTSKGWRNGVVIQLNFASGCARTNWSVFSTAISRFRWPRMVALSVSTTKSTAAGVTRRSVWKRHRSWLAN